MHSITNQQPQFYYRLNDSSAAQRQCLQSNNNLMKTERLKQTILSTADDTGNNSPINVTHTEIVRVLSVTDNLSNIEHYKLLITIYYFFPNDDDRPVTK